MKKLINRGDTKDSRILMKTTELMQIREKIAKHLECIYLCAGLGNEKSHCIIAALNIVLGNGLTDSCPPSVCPVIHRFVERAQDNMPDSMRNSKELKALIPFMAGTENKESELLRVTFILEWMKNSPKQVQST